VNKLTSARGPLTGLLLILAVSLLGSGCVVDATETDDQLGMTDEPLAAWEADRHQGVAPARDEGEPDRGPEVEPPVEFEANAEVGDDSDGTSNPDPTPWNGSTANVTGGDGNPDPTPWLEPDEEEGEEGENDEGREGEPDPQPWMSEVSVVVDHQD
jgi:hypothetical protein